MTMAASDLIMIGAIDSVPQANIQGDARSECSSCANRWGQGALRWNLCISAPDRSQTANGCKSWPQAVSDLVDCRPLRFLEAHQMYSGSFIQREGALHEIAIRGEHGQGFIRG